MFDIKDLKIVNGDLVLSNGDLQLVRDNALLAQKCTLILSTNLNEWFLNRNEGINFSAILRKNPNYDEIIDTIRNGLRQVDDTFNINDYSIETNGRKMTINFTASTESGETVSLSIGESKNSTSSIVDIFDTLDAKTEVISGGAMDAILISESDINVYEGEL